MSPPPPRSDHIRLLNLSFWGRHGHFAEERARGGRFEVDADLRCELSAAIQTDRLSSTVDVQQVYEIIRRRVEEETYHLLETLAQSIALDLLQFRGVLEVTVRVRKVTPPLAGATQGVMEVEVTRVP
ncbi:MAG: dihydroneopterin aldolase [bacterium]